MADGWLGGLRGLRIAMDAQQEVRVDEHSFERELNPGVETSTIAAAVVEELEQRLHILVRHRPAIGQPRDPREDLRGAGLLFRREPRLTDKIARRLGVSFAGAVIPERTANL